MKRFRIVLAIALAIVWSVGRAAAPAPVVNDNSLSWAGIAATTINVHRGDGSYLESIPGSATSWIAPEPGDYFLVAADEGDWRDWPRSAVVTVDEESATSGAPIPFVERNRLIWAPVQAVSINVHRGDGSYVESLPGTASDWLAPEYGEYFLVATNEGSWQSWPRSRTVTISNSRQSVDGLRASVYSTTAAEVFWEREAGSGIRYRVLVDGQEPVDIDGTSWYSDSFEPGSTTVVSVAILDADNNQSAYRSVIVTTPGGDAALATPVINQDNYEQLLVDVFGVYFGIQSRPVLDLNNDLLSGGFISAAYPFDAPYTCVNGGEAIFEGPYHIEFDDCRVESAVVSGEFHIADRTAGFGSHGLTMSTDLGEEIRFDGNIDGPVIYYPGYYEALGINYSVNTASGEIRVEDASHSFAFSHLQSCCGDSQNFQSSYQGSFKLRSPATGNQSVGVDTHRTFFYSRPRPLGTDQDYQPAGWNHQEGVLSVVAADGSRMILNADTGADETVFVQLVNGSEREEFTRSWAPQWAAWRQILVDDQ